MTKDIHWKKLDGKTINKSVLTPMRQNKATKTDKELKDNHTKAKKIKVKKNSTNLEKTKVTQQQTPLVLQLSDFEVHTTSDANNLYLTTTYLRTPIHKLIFPFRDFFVWQRVPPQQKYRYILARVNPETFNNDLLLVQILVTSYVHRINAVLTRLQQQQVQAQMAYQQTLQAKRRM